MDRKDLFIIDTRTLVNKAMVTTFENKGYVVKVASGFDGVPDEVLRDARGYTAIGMCSNRKISPEQVDILKENNNRLILCFGAGFDNVPLAELKANKIRLGRVPSYSPASIAEYAVTSMVALAKNVQKSYEMTKVANFSVASLHCLLLEDKVAGVIGTGIIGKKAVEKLSGLVKKVVCYDKFPCEDWIKTVANAEYVSFDDLLEQSNMVSIHCPLLPETTHLINAESIEKMRQDVIIVNTSRGAVVDTRALIDGLKSGKIFGAALDVFEGENHFVWRDMSESGFKNYPDIQELAAMHNVIISSHIAFYTDESIRKIAEISLENFEGFVGVAKMNEANFEA